ncbi:DegT/DnrJ/EryC1/StrS family aminotransferase [Terasakiella pusilla]|uniref:DegT/DnrJ/EryC1/StrS family aminotransferase n=1 Tax=Terasakiella pusilla TaxID=64973 RepID=UPI003AA9711D
MSNNKRQIPIALPSLGEEEWQAVREPIFSGWLTQGPKVAEFEKDFADIHNVSHAMATTSCTSALHIALKALGVGPGDEVIVPAFTWVATANAVLYCGATPVLVDVSCRTYNLEVTECVAAVTERTKAVVTVHAFGLCADMDELKKALPQNIHIVEDAACAAGAIHNNQFAGTLGDIAAFSFHPRKSITTGEGGMITSNHSGLMEEAEKLRNHGLNLNVGSNKPRPYDMPDVDVLGFNYRMTDLQAAVGIVQLGKLNRFIEERGRWAKWYNDQFAEIDWIQCPEEPENGRHSWQSYVIYVDPDKAPHSRNEIMDALLAEGISTRPGTQAVHMLSFYAEKYGFQKDDFPGAFKCYSNTIALPLHNQMTQEDFEYVRDAIVNISQSKII